MVVKSSILLCISTLFISTVMGQCFGRDSILGAGFPSPSLSRPFDGVKSFDGLGSAWPSTGCSAGSLAPQSGLAASYGGGLSITSSSPISPTGLTVNSENVIEGSVTIGGQLPFLGAVATDGAFNTAGLGTVTYGCGDGTIGITAETPINPTAPNYGTGSTYGHNPAVSGYKGVSPIGGCGCGVLY